MLFSATVIGAAPPPTPTGPTAGPEPEPRVSRLKPHRAAPKAGASAAVVPPEPVRVQARPEVMPTRQGDAAKDSRAPSSAGLPPPGPPDRLHRAACDQLIRLAQGADLFLCEASYLDGAEIDYRANATGGELNIRAPKIKGSAPAAVANVLDQCKPGARVAMAGMKFFPWWLAPLHLLAWLKNLPYNVHAHDMHEAWSLVARQGLAGDPWQDIAAATARQTCARGCCSVASHSWVTQLCTWARKKRRCCSRLHTATSSPAMR